MSDLQASGRKVSSIFQLIGNKENDITKSIAWALCKCPFFLKNVMRYLLQIDIDPKKVNITYQQYEPEKGITDLELTDGEQFYVIIEAKRGWNLPDAIQLTKYADRESLKKSSAKMKAIVSMSECSSQYASGNLPFLSVKGIPIKHLSWKMIYKIVNESRAESNNEQKHLLDELRDYMGGIMTMQKKDSNWVYVVSLGTSKPEGCNLTWIDIVKKHNKYFCPVGGKGWPKEPPNYIAFRYAGELQAIHHIESYVVTKNIHDEISDMPDEVWQEDHFVYRLGKEIKPGKTVKTGKIYPNGRVWAMLDTLLTSDTISEARDISKTR